MELIIEELTKSYANKLAVDHINMRINQGSFIAFLGPNGAGKSTTVGMLTGLIIPTSGSIHLGGLTPGTAAYRNKLGVVFQNSVLDDRLTVQQNLKIRMQMYNRISPDYFQLLITEFGVNRFLKQKYGTLSGGQRRRVDIVRSLLHQPEILILDEPSTGLDIQTRNVIWNTLKKLQKKMQLTIILTTHYLEETENADYVYIIDNGRIIASNSIEQLKQTYAKYHLTLISNDFDQLLQQLNNAGLKPKKEHEKVQLLVDSSTQCIAILNHYQRSITSFECRQSDMNDIFVHLTGKEIR